MLEERRDDFAPEELRCERDDLLVLFLADDDRDFRDREEELDLLRDELFLRAVAMKSNLLRIQTRAPSLEVVLRARPTQSALVIATYPLSNHCLRFAWQKQR